MYDLKAKIEEIRELISIYKESCFNKNEQAVCDDIIKPLLNTLGWKSNPDYIVPKECSDDGKYPDYTLKKNKKAVLILEAKKMSTNVTEDKVISQIAQYCYNQSTSFGIMTNGETWLLFETFQRVKTDRIVWSINILTDSIEKSMNLLGTLNYENIESLELRTKMNKTLDQLWQNLKSDKGLFIKPISDLLKSHIKISNPDLTYQDEEIENFASSKIDELFSKDNYSIKPSNIQTRSLSSSGKSFEIIITPSMITHNCIYFSKKELDSFPSPGTEITIYFNNDHVTAKTTLKNPTHIYKLSKFWLKHPDVRPDDKIRLTIIKKFEEYRIDVI
jgi:hypothetical protein